LPFADIYSNLYSLLRPVAKAAVTDIYVQRENYSNTLAKY